MAYAWRDCVFFFSFVLLRVLVWHHVKARLRPCVSCFVSINYATTCLENPDGHSLINLVVYLMVSIVCK